MFSCEVRNNQVIPSLIATDVHEGEACASWVELVTARLLGRVKTEDGTDIACEQSTIRILRSMTLGAI